MPERSARQRRSYRLAVLLTGDRQAAIHVVRRAARGDRWLTLDSAHLDRLTILLARAIPNQAIVDAGIDAEAAARLAGLTAQQREAWVLQRVYGTPAREAARAMDCSVAATQRHLELADQIMGQGAAREAAATMFGRCSTGLDLPEFFWKAQRRRRLMARTLLGAAIVTLVCLIVAVMLIRRP